MAFINRENVFKSEPHRFIGNASDMGWPPGQWPTEVSTDMGNGTKMIRTRMNFNEENDLLSCEYRQLLGCISVIVFND